MAGIKERVGVGRGSAVVGVARPLGGTVSVARLRPDENRAARPVAVKPDRAALRLFDASAGLSLAGCVPAVPASVSPRTGNMPHSGAAFNSYAERGLGTFCACAVKDSHGRGE